MPGARVMAPENLVDAVQRLDQLVTDLRNMLFGNQETRTAGLLNEVDAIKARLDSLTVDVAELKARRGSRGMWTVGYLSLGLAVMFALFGMSGLGGHTIMDVPAPFALFLSALFVVAAVPAFWEAYGWLK